MKLWGAMWGGTCGTPDVLMMSWLVGLRCFKCSMFSIASYGRSWGNFFCLGDVVPCRTVDCNVQVTLLVLCRHTQFVHIGNLTNEFTETSQRPSMRINWMQSKRANFERMKHMKRTTTQIQDFYGFLRFMMAFVLLENAVVYFEARRLNPDAQARDWGRQHQDVLKDSIPSHWPLIHSQFTSIHHNLPSLHFIFFAIPARVRTQ